MVDNLNIHQSASLVRYVAHISAVPQDLGEVGRRGILQSMDAGNHWKLVTDGIPAATVDSVRFHPLRKSEAFLVQYGKIYQSVDGGSSWKLFPSEGLEQSSVRMLWFASDLPARIFALSSGRGALFYDLPPPDLAKQGDPAISLKANE